MSGSSEQARFGMISTGLKNDVVCFFFCFFFHLRSSYHLNPSHHLIFYSFPVKILSLFSSHLFRSPLIMSPHVSSWNIISQCISCHRSSHIPSIASHIDDIICHHFPDWSSSASERPSVTTTASLDLLGLKLHSQWLHFRWFGMSFPSIDRHKIARPEGPSPDREQLREGYLFLLFFVGKILVFILDSFVGAFPASLLFCFFAFPASLLFCYCASVPFYLYNSTFSFLQLCVFAAPFPAPLLLYFLSLLSLFVFHFLLLSSFLFVSWMKP